MNGSVQSYANLKDKASPYNQSHLNHPYDHWAGAEVGANST